MPTNFEKAKCNPGVTCHHSRTLPPELEQFHRHCVKNNICCLYSKNGHIQTTQQLKYRLPDKYIPRSALARFKIYNQQTLNATEEAKAAKLLRMYNLINREPARSRRAATAPPTGQRSATLPRAAATPTFNTPLSPEVEVGPVANAPQSALPPVVPPLVCPTTLRPLRTRDGLSGNRVQIKQEAPVAHTTYRENNSADFSAAYRQAWQSSQLQSWQRAQQNLHCAAPFFSRENINFVAAQLQRNYVQTLIDQLHLEIELTQSQLAFLEQHVAHDTNVPRTTDHRQTKQSPTWPLNTADNTSMPLKRPRLDPQPPPRRMAPGVRIMTETNDPLSPAEPSGRGFNAQGSPDLSGWSTEQMPQCQQTWSPSTERIPDCCSSTDVSCKGVSCNPRRHDATVGSHLPKHNDPSQPADTVWNPELPSAAQWTRHRPLQVDIQASREAQRQMQSTSAPGYLHSLNSYNTPQPSYAHGGPLLPTNTPASLSIHLPLTPPDNSFDNLDASPRSKRIRRHSFSGGMNPCHDKLEFLPVPLSDTKCPPICSTAESVLLGQEKDIVRAPPTWKTSISRSRIRIGKHILVFCLACFMAALVTSLSASDAKASQLLRSAFICGPMIALTLFFRSMWDCNVRVVAARRQAWRLGWLLLLLIPFARFVYLLSFPSTEGSDLSDTLDTWCFIPLLLVPQMWQYKAAGIAPTSDPRRWCGQSIYGQWAHNFAVTAFGAVAIMLRAFPPFWILGVAVLPVLAAQAVVARVWDKIVPPMDRLLWTQVRFLATLSLMMYFQKNMLPRGTIPIWAWELVLACAATLGLLMDVPITKQALSWNFLIVGYGDLISASALARLAPFSAEFWLVVHLKAGLIVCAAVAGFLINAQIWRGDAVVEGASWVWTWCHQLVLSFTVSGFCLLCSGLSRLAIVSFANDDEGLAIVELSRVFQFCLQIFMGLVLLLVVRKVASSVLNKPPQGVPQSITEQPSASEPIGGHVNCHEMDDSTSQSVQPSQDSVSRTAGREDRQDHMAGLLLYLEQQLSLNLHEVHCLTYLFAVPLTLAGLL